METVKTRWQNRRIGSTGSAARRSTKTNAASATTDPANSPMMTGDDHAYSVPPQLVASVSPAAPTATSAMPA